MRTAADKLRWLAKIAADQESTSAALSVAVALASYHNCQTQICNPSISSICRAAGLSERAARRGIRSLEEIGAISRRSTRGGQIASTTQFDLLAGRSAEGMTPGDIATPEHVDSPETRSTNAFTPGGNATPGANATPGKIGSKPPALAPPKQKDKNKTITPPYSPPPLGVDVSAWGDLDEYRRTHRVKKVRDSWTPLAQRKAAAMLAELPAEDQRRTVDMTIANGWQGIFPDRVKTNGRKSNEYADIERRVLGDVFEQDDEGHVRQTVDIRRSHGAGPAGQVVCLAASVRGKRS